MFQDDFYRQGGQTKEFSFGSDFSDMGGFGGGRFGGW